MTVIQLVLDYWTPAGNHITYRKKVNFDDVVKVLNAMDQAAEDCDE